ncbi:MAG: ATP-binding protein [Ruminiclostridium sp.]
MKKMTRLLLINWHYFQNTLIDFGMINFLTGKNSAGKSTIIDALQVVLMGETRSVAFNRAASKKSERTLKSYLVGSMGEDIESGNRSVREGKDFSTYIVAEFFDDFKAEHFCLGAVFDTFSDGSETKRKFFWLRSMIPEFRFIENGKTMAINDMLKYFKEKYPNKYETRDGTESYRQLALTKLNIHVPKFITMLRKAISFEPINDIEKFITEYVCDIEDDIDITAMQDNILNYKRQEEIAQSFENKLKKLEEICGLYSEIEKLRSRHKIQQFLIDYGTFKDFEQQLDDTKLKLKEYNEHISEFKQEYEEIGKHIKQLEDECERLRRDKEKYWSENNGDWLESEKKRIISDIEKYNEMIASFILEIKTSSVCWLNKFGSCFEKIEDEEIKESINRVISYLKRTEQLSEKDFELLSPEFFGSIRASYLLAKEKIEPILSEVKGQLVDLRGQADNLRKQIEALQKGVKAYPDEAVRLKSAIQEGLTQKYNEEIPVSFLADLIEVTDEEWHNAVEGYLNTQRMNIIVPPQYFMDAYLIYKEARERNGFYRFAVVDLQKAYEFGSTPKKDSLASVVKSQDKYVQAYIDFLLGNVIRCYSDDKIRDFRTSVTRECMVYHSFAVKALKPDAYRNPYIGMNSIEKQIEIKTKQLRDINAAIAEKSGIANALKPVVSGEWFLAENYISSAVCAVFGGYNSRKEANEKLQEINVTLDKIDFYWLDEMDVKISNIKAQIAAAYDKKEEASNFINNFERERDDTVANKIPQLEKNIFVSRQTVTDRYSVEYQNTTGIPRFEAELSDCKAAAAVRDKYISPVKATLTGISERENILTEKRSNYNAEEKASFKVADVSDNSEYEEAYQKIKDYELPKYKERIEKAKTDAMEQFQSDFLYKLRGNIQNAYEKIDDLNKALKIAQFGNDTYKFKVEPNPDYRDYYDMIMSDLLENGNVGLFSYAFTDKYQTVIDNLFSQIISLDGDTGKIEKNVELFSKYKTYLTFDLLSTDSNGRTDKLSKSIFTKSGGETQTPFYIAVLASFAELYKVNDNSDYGNTARIVIFDEAFNKMDGERIIESVRLLRKFGLQAIICSPPEKVADIAPVSDKALLVHKEAVGNIYKSTVIEWTKEMSEM